MSNLVARTPQIIAAEINSIKEQTQRILLHNSIEIGRRLVEAKELVGHGNWGEWLGSSVEYSQRTASNLIRIFEEYGASQITLLGDNSNSQALANLTYTQAVALLGIPSEERETFVEENNIAELTTRQLQEAIKERDKALNDKNDIAKKLDTTKSDLQREKDARLAVEASLKLVENNGAIEELEELRKKLAELESKPTVEVPQEPQEDLSEELMILKGKLDAANKTIDMLERETEKEPETVEVIPQETLDEIETLKRKIKAGEQTAAFTVTFKTTQKMLNDLTVLTTNMEPEQQAKARTAIRSLCEQVLQVTEGE